MSLRLNCGNMTMAAVEAICNVQKEAAAAANVIDDSRKVKELNRCEEEEKHGSTDIDNIGSPESCASMASMESIESIESMEGTRESKPARP